MNLKKAKFLRKLTLDVLEMKDEVQPPGTYMVHRQHGNIINHPLTKRGIYRRIKKEAR